MPTSVLCREAEDKVVDLFFFETWLFAKGRKFKFRGAKKIAIQACA